MISFIKGRIYFWEDESLIIDVGGIGYQVFVPRNLFEETPNPGDEIFLYTYMQIREDSWQLYGFPEKEQLNIFRNLISVSGVGAKLGITILNHLSVRNIIQAVLEGENNVLGSIPGIGKKMSERLILELKGKFAKLEFFEIEKRLPYEQQNGSDKSDAVLALTQLGYSISEARNAVEKAFRVIGQSKNTQEIIKGALKLLSKA